MSYPVFVQPKLEGCEKFKAVYSPSTDAPLIYTETDAYLIIPDIWNRPLERIFDNYSDITLEGYFIPNTPKVYITRLESVYRTTEECVKLLKMISSLETTEDFLFLKSIKCNNSTERQAATKQLNEEGFPKVEVNQSK